jgi:FkbM family methyltransferase
MRRALFYNPRLLCERLALESARRRRIARLKGTPASALSLGHIDTLELLELLNPADIKVIYDIGANVGTWTLLAKAIIPHAQLHAFEPMPEHCRGFADNTTQVSGVALHQAALGAEEKSANLHVMDFSDASSILPLADAGRVQFGIREIERRPILLATLDHWRASHDLPPPDLIKLDVQGYEADVLKGAPECVRRATAIITEVSFVAFYRDQGLFADILCLLAGYGFKLHALGMSTPLGQRLTQTDALFLRDPDRLPVNIATTA